MTQHRKVTAELVAALVALVLVVWYVGQQWDTIGLAVGPTCRVGISGTAAVVTVHGWGADASCAAMARDNGAYSYDGPAPTIPVVCQYPYGGVRLTVQDDGLLKSEGAALCTRFQAEQH